MQLKGRMSISPGSVTDWGKRADAPKPLKRDEPVKAAKDDNGTLARAIRNSIPRRDGQHMIWSPASDPPLAVAGPPFATAARGRRHPPSLGCPRASIRIARPSHGRRNRAVICGDVEGHVTIRGGIAVLSEPARTRRSHGLAAGIKPGPQILSSPVRKLCVTRSTGS